MQKDLNTKQINVLICQIKPIFKNQPNNLARIGQSLSKYSSSDLLDLVMFPQLAFIGYNFKDFQDIFPYTQVCGQGQSFKFCQNLAKGLNSYIIYGYAEKVHNITNLQKKSQKWNLYNSACVIDRDGKIVQNTRKTFMYCSDELWCIKGDGFKTVTIYNLYNQPIKCTIGICMDINPQGFISGKYQLADFINQTQSEILLFLSAWNDSQPNHPNQHKSQMNIINYWVQRLLPVIKTPKNKKRSLLVLVCDRTGQQITYTDKKQSKTQFIGTSCVLRVNPHQLIEKVGKKNQEYLKTKVYIKHQK